MPTPLRNNNEIKIFILFLMDRMGYPLDYETIGAIVVQDGVVRYFDFAQCFGELLEAGHVCEVKGTSEQLTLDADPEPARLYAVTDSGRQVARVLGENLMASVRDQGIRSAMRHLSLKRLGAEIDQGYTENGGDVVYHCTIRDKKGELLNLSLRLDNRRDLETATETFADRPEVVYRGLLALLSGDVNYLFD